MKKIKKLHTRIFFFSIFISLFFHFAPTVSNFYVIAADGKNYSERLSYKKIRTIEIYGGCADVILNGYSGSDVSGIMTIPSFMKEKQGIVISHKKTGTTLKVEIKQKKAYKLSIPGLTSAKLELKIPNNAIINIKSTSGGITVNTVNTKVYAKTKSGSIKINNSGGFIHAVSSSGGHTFTSYKGNITSESSSGGCKLSKVNGKLIATNKTGKIWMSESKIAVTAKTTSGDIYGINLIIIGGSSFATTIGDIKIQLDNKLNNYKFDLTATTGSLKVGTTWRKKRLKTGTGKILITGKSTAGDQLYL